MSPAQEAWARRRGIKIPPRTPVPPVRWELWVLDPIVGEFRLRFTDTLHMWSEESREWLPVSEGDLAELAIREAERKES